jgi:O-antigen/teichoic acid export membrane protein
MLRYESPETLGAYSVILQIVAYLQLLELGMSRAISRGLAQATDGATLEFGLSKLVSTSLAFLFGVGILTGALTGLLAWTLPGWFSAAPPVLAAARQALLLFALWMLARFPLSFYHLHLFAKQRIALYGGFSLLGDVLRAGLSLGFIWKGWGLVGLAAANILPEFMTFGLSWYCSREDFGKAARWAKPDLPVLKSLLKVGLPLSLMSLGDRLTFYSQDMIVGGLFGATAVAAVYATRMPGFTLGSILWRTMDSVSPGLNDLYGRNLHDSFRSAHYRLVSYTLGIGVWVAAGIYTFNRPIVELWVGNSLYLAGGVTSGVAFLILVATLNCVLTNFAIVEGRLANYPFVVFGAGIIAVASSIVLGRAWGAAGVLWAAGVSNLITTVFLVINNCRIFRVGLRELYAPILMRALRCSAPGVLACLAYLAASALGVRLQWMAGITAVFSIGMAGFIYFGLLPEDRGYLAGWINVGRLIAWRQPLSGE